MFGFVIVFDCCKVVVCGGYWVVVYVIGIVEKMVYKNRERYVRFCVSVLFINNMFLSFINFEGFLMVGLFVVVVFCVGVFVGDVGLVFFDFFYW